MGEWGERVAIAFADKNDDVAYDCESVNRR